MQNNESKKFNQEDVRELPGRQTPRQDLYFVQKSET
jgi:hypothetical protein